VAVLINLPQIVEEIVTNPKWHERLVDAVRGRVIRALERA